MSMFMSIIIIIALDRQ